MTELFPVSDLEALDLPDGDLRMASAPDLGGAPDYWFERLEGELDWREETIRLFGKTFLQPRLLAWHGDPGARYRYSGRMHEPLAWTPSLAALRSRVEELTGARFNSVLANLYRNEQDSMGLHADDEPELGEQPVIASLSLGEERVFRLKHRRRQDLKPVRLGLPSGSLLIMAGDTQKNWKHEVPKQSRPCGPRINLTFRHIDPGLATRSRKRA
jgi:alkylated DNA repair dioxygenase AlkB